MVHLGANACIVGRNVEKTESMAKDIATARKGAKVIGIGAVDVRKPELLQEREKDQLAQRVHQQEGAAARPQRVQEAAVAEQRQQEEAAADLK